MPIFEYICNACGNRFELIARNDKGSGCCPGCDSVDVRRLPSAPAIQFKGEGWTKKGGT